MSSGGRAPSSSARLSRLYDVSAASSDRFATSKLPRASTTDQYCPAACRMLLLTSAAKLAFDWSRLRRAMTSGAVLANHQPLRKRGWVNWRFRAEEIEGFRNEKLLLV